jgi:type II secretory pathway pseudopilin PulG
MNPRAGTIQRRKSAAAFTLVELLVAMGVLPLLLLGLASAVLVARHAVPDGKRGPSATLSAGRALEQLAADLQYATSVQVTLPTEIVVTTEDRNGDGTPETIRYAWSGTPGDPLVRQVNGAATVPVAAGVEEFRLEYALREEQLPTTSSEGAERLLAHYVALAYLDGFRVSSDQWCGQDFVPDLPSDATAWRVTRVGFRARSAGPATGEIRVQLRASAASRPTMNVLAEVPVLEKALPTLDYQWVEVPFTAAPQVPAGTPMSLVLMGVPLEDSANVQYQALSATAATSRFVKTTDAGATWSVPLAQDMSFYVYGVVSTPDPPSYRKLLDSVQFTLRCQAAGSATLTGSVRTLNQPAAPTP